MAQKLSLEEFKKIKQQLSNLISEYYDNYDTYISNYTFKELEEKYYKIQEELLSYDLSDIAFEEWEGIEIHSDRNHIANFSKTHANIDFKLIDFDYNLNIILNGCNIRNSHVMKNRIDLTKFDEETIKNNSNLFLSDKFSLEFKNKYYDRKLVIEDLFDLSDEQLSELEEKDIASHVYLNKTHDIIIVLGLKRIIELYHYSKEDYEFVTSAASNFCLSYNIKSFKNIDYFNELLQKIRKVNISELKKEFNLYLRNIIIHSRESIHIKDLSEAFIKENKDLLLIDSSVKDGLRSRYYTRKLSLYDVIENIDLFENIPIENFMKDRRKYTDLSYELGEGNLIKIIKKHPDVIKHVCLEYNFHIFKEILNNSDFKSEKKFKEAVKQIFIEYNRPIYNIPNWISSMNFNFVDEISTLDDLMNYKEDTVVLNTSQQKTINILGIENIKKLEYETKIFSPNTSYKELEIFKVISNYLKDDRHVRSVWSYDEAYYDYDIENFLHFFKNGSLSYPLFRDKFAKLLGLLRSKSAFKDVNYDFIEGKFREDYPEIFIDHRVPAKLIEAFYDNKISISLMFEYKDYLKYFLDKNLKELINDKITLCLPGSYMLGRYISHEKNFIEEYIEKYGNEKLLKLISKYGNLLSKIRINSFEGEIDDEQKIEEAIVDAIYEWKIKYNYPYAHLQEVPEFVSKYPELFVDFKKINVPYSIEKSFYNGNLTFDDIKKYPQLVSALKEKRLDICFSNIERTCYKVFNSIKSDLILIEVLGNENFLELCVKYGRYMNNISEKLSNELVLIDGNIFDKKIQDTSKKNILSFEQIEERIKKIIANDCALGNIEYTEEDAPEFLKKEYPELFLSEDAKDNLKIYFYGKGYRMTFDVLSKHYKEWESFLKDKSIVTSLLRNKNIHHDMIDIIAVFGEETAIKLIVSKPETVTSMIAADKIDLMKKWYEKTGCRFIPDAVVMQNFSESEIDKFLFSASSWSSLMRIKGFKETSESKDAVLKLAYSFGVFDNDKRGFNKLQTLLTSIPKSISFENYSIISKIDNQIDNLSIRKKIFNVKVTTQINKSGMIVPCFVCQLTEEEKEEAYNKMIENLEESYNLDSKDSYNLFDKKTLIRLFKSLKEEVPDIDFSQKIFSQIYRLNEDFSRTLIINPQSCPKSVRIIRSILEQFVTLNMLTAEKAHQLFGGFKLKYDPEFREFLLENIDKILGDPQYASHIANIQKQFDYIKAANSNRKLTLDLAISYVENNKYKDVDLGNERVSEISAIAGYSQEDFEQLQKIYNYGKQRIFSSIPRIENKTDKYIYEMLRLDDPLAMAIGTLSNCCQEIGNVAEVCMEHSMVDKNGRVFVVRDKEGNIVAQSWVWRNKNVLCFDNIEIPSKAFERFTKKYSNLSRKDFAEEIYEVYKKAAEELIEKDEEEYKKLLEEGKITIEQYEGLRLGKITVGLGYNDIAESLKKNAKLDDEISRPIVFKPPVRLSRGLYTSDSTTQYILEEEERKPYDGDTIPIHSDSYIEYDNSNFKEKLLLSLGKMEIKTKGFSNILDIQRNKFDRKKIVSEIANLYDLNEDNTKIIIHPNFAIIYEVSDDKVKIADLFYNTKIENDVQQMNIENTVAMQIRLALDQIGKDKEVDISNLDDKQKEMYNKAINLTSDKFDFEKEISFKQNA